MKHKILHAQLPFVLLSTLVGFGIMGYHPGYEDDEIYLTAVKSALNPALYPHDGKFFRLQMQATVFDGWMAWIVTRSHLPLAWIELLGQLAAIFLILWSANRIAGVIFPLRRAQVAAVAMVAAMLTLPVAGTALLIADQHLHPRNLATALTLAALACILKKPGWLAVPLLAVALLLHPIMGVFGISLAVILTFAGAESSPAWFRAGILPTPLPLGWVLAAPNPTWRVALATRRFYFLMSWTWYEWLGALAPLALFWLLWRFARRRGDHPLARMALAVLLYGLLHQSMAILMLTPTALERLTPLQPMRYLQLEYLLMVLLAGGLLGQYVLKGKPWRWAVYLLAINGGMLSAQWALFDGQAHFEMPWSAPSNPWTEAFAWVRQNTPPAAYFALDPNYLARPGQGYHGFRALAERSKLSDGIKDTAVVTQVPSLAPAWREQQLALAGWQHFTATDFARLKARFGVDWVLVENARQTGLSCPWENGTVSVCRIP